MNNQSNPKALMIMACAVLVLGGGATFFQFKAAQAAKDEVTALEGEVPTQEDLEKSLSESQAKLTEYQQKLAHLEKSVPDVAYIPTLMKELELIGKGHGIQVTGVRPAPAVMMPGQTQEGKKKEKKNYDEIEIEIKGRGRYDDIKAFLDSLQKFPKVIAVKTVGLTPFRESGDGPSGDIEVVINVSAFVFAFELITASSQVEPAPGEAVTTTQSSSVETRVMAKGGGRK